MWAPLEGFQVTSEGEALKLKRKSSKICFGKKMTNKSREGFLLTTKFYKSVNDTAILAPGKRNRAGKASKMMEEKE